MEMQFQNFQKRPLTKTEREMLVTAASAVVNELNKLNHSKVELYENMLNEAKEYEWFNPVNFKNMLNEIGECISKDAYNLLLDSLEKLCDKE